MAVVELGLPGPAPGADLLPSPPLTLSAAASPTSTSVTVSWAFAPGGAAPDRAQVTALLGGVVPVGAVTCAMPRCTTMVLPGLVAGDSYSFAVQSGTAQSWSTPAMTRPVVVASGCAGASVCLGVDATANEGPSAGRAAGLLQGSEGPASSSLLAPLDIKSWRLAVGAPLCQQGQCVGYGEFDSVRSYASYTTAVLSDNWYEYSRLDYRECPNLLACVLTGSAQPYGGARAPWSSWPDYDAFTTGVVRQIEASGRKVGYWDLVNEPPSQTPQNDAYLDAADSSSLTAADLEQWLLHTYQDVEAADATAKVVCPSFESYQDFPGETAPYNQVLDFSTFLAFADSHGLKCDAYSWHEINSVGSATDFNNQPETIADHVARFRQLLARHPALGSPQIFINEYGAGVPPVGAQSYESMPGWSAGDIAALEQARVDAANRSCPTMAGCEDLLDGLLVNVGVSLRPSATYWLYRYYAQMTGAVVPVTTSAEQVSGFAALDSGSKTLRLLLGRHETQGSGIAAPQSVKVTVEVPWATGRVVVTGQPFANSGGPVASPPTGASTVGVTAGRATLTIPSFGSEDAFGITITPDGASS